MITQQSVCGARSAVVRTAGLATLLLAFALSGCDNRQNDFQQSLARAEASYVKQLADTQWALLDASGIPAPTIQNAPRLNFAADGSTVSGFAGVNRFTGTYTEGRSSITFSELAVTKMAGSPQAMANELAFLAILSGEVDFVRSGNIMLIENDQQMSATFRLLSDLERDDTDNP